MDLEAMTFSIIGCAMRVHTSMGSGFPEIVYQRCLAVELKKSKISFLREEEQPVFYDGVLVGTRRADFIVAGQVMVELKAMQQIENAHLVQAKNYLKAYQLPVGLLINFGGKSLEYKRIFP